MYDTDDIKRYILYLKNECGLSITLHPCVDENLISASDLISFNIHDNSYCVFVKTFSRCREHCVERQKRIMEKCREGSFCGVCYAGVREYVYPIHKDGITVGFICVGGYRHKGAKSYLQRTSERYDVPYEALCTAYGVLKEEMPDKSWVDVLVTPLRHMLELAYLKNAAPQEEGFVERVIRYLKMNHAGVLSIDDICRHFSCSRSHLCHSFKARTGKTVGAYLTTLRLEDAKSLLRYSALSVTEIAYSVGFGDSNYFSNVFKKHIGLSPAAYRKK